MIYTWIYLQALYFLLLFSNPENFPNALKYSCTNEHYSSQLSIRVINAQLLAAMCCCQQIKILCISVHKKKIQTLLQLSDLLWSVNFSRNFSYLLALIIDVCKQVSNRFILENMEIMSKRIDLHLFYKIETKNQYVSSLLLSVKNICGVCTDNKQSIPCCLDSSFFTYTSYLGLRAVSSGKIKNNEAHQWERPDRLGTCRSLLQYCRE